MKENLAAVTSPMGSKPAFKLIACSQPFFTSMVILIRTLKVKTWRLQKNQPLWFHVSVSCLSFMSQTLVLFSCLGCNSQIFFYLGLSSQSFSFIVSFLCWICLFTSQTQFQVCVSTFWLSFKSHLFSVSVSGLAVYFCLGFRSGHLFLSQFQVWTSVFISQLQVLICFLSLRHIPRFVLVSYLSFESHRQDPTIRCSGAHAFFFLICFRIHTVCVCVCEKCQSFPQEQYLWVGHPLKNLTKQSLRKSTMVLLTCWVDTSPSIQP